MYILSLYFFVVMKAQSLNFISNHNMNFSRGGGGNCVFGVLLIFSAVDFRLKKIVDCDCEFRCVYLSFHSDFICCVLRDLHADSLLGSFTRRRRRCVPSSSDDHARSWTDSIYGFPTLSPLGFLLCFLDLNRNSRFKAGQ